MFLRGIKRLGCSFFKSRILYSNADDKGLCKSLSYRHFIGRSFFSSSSVPGKTIPPKKESAEINEDSSSPIKVKKRKRETLALESEDEDSNSHHSSKSENSSIKDETSPQKSSKQINKFRDFFNSDENSPKKIRTYSRSNEEKSKNRVKVKGKIVDKDTSESEEESNETAEEISETKAESVIEVKSKTSKTLTSFFGSKSESTNVDVMKHADTSPKGKSNAEKDVPLKMDDYDPFLTNYHPINDACWKRGEKVPYLALCKTLEAIENISARLKMITILSNFFRSVIVLTPDDLTICIYLCLNKLAPDYEGLELGVGDTVLMKAIALTTGKSVESIKSHLKSKGDLGLVAESCRINQRTMFTPPKPTARAVYVKLREIAEMTGHSSASKKVERIQSLLVACSRLEARYLIRSLVGKLRIGLAEQSLLAALGEAVTSTPVPQEDWPPKVLDSSKKMSKDEYNTTLEKNALTIKSVYCECPSYDAIIPVLLKDGIARLSEVCKITPGVPVKPMLANPTKGVEEILKRFQDCNFTCEFKYDGERAQIHVLDDKSIKIYSRNQEDNTSKYPDVISRFSNSMKDDVKSCILDTEAVAWDKENKQILPFQILSTRKRKDASESQIKVQVCIFSFDLIYLNGKSLVAEPFKERRRLLHEHFQEIEGEFVFVTSKDLNVVDEIAGFLDEAITSKCEGLMVKTLETNATYEIAKRSHNWLKLKKDYLEGVGDTLDLVVVGGYFGKGKRTGNYGGFLLACYDPDNETFQTITKLGTGFKDEDLVQLSASLKENVIPKPKSYYQFDSSQEPDVWFDATQVWEIKCADLSISPVYKAAAGILDSTRGISVRFPRFIRVREDKNPEDATTNTQVVSMYESQENVKKPSASK